jgi:hypothetical protein
MPKDFAAPYISEELSDSTTIEAGSSVDYIKGTRTGSRVPFNCFWDALLSLSATHNLHYRRQEIIRYQRFVEKRRR